jgi:hypothetical protein
MFQGLGLANALERGPLYLPDQSIDPLEDFPVRALPIEIILPGVLGENEPHSRSSRSMPPPDSSSAMDSMSL